MRCIATHAWTALRRVASLMTLAQRPSMPGLGMRAPVKAMSCSQRKGPSAQQHATAVLHVPLLLLRAEEILEALRCLYGICSKGRYAAGHSQHLATRATRMTLLWLCIPSASDIRLVMHAQVE